MTFPDKIRFFYRIKGNKEDAEATFFPIRNCVLFRLETLNKVKKCRIKRGTDAEISRFCAYLAAVELHEMGHAFNFHKGCDDVSLCGTQKCGWCEVTEKFYDWLK